MAFDLRLIVYHLYRFCSLIIICDFSSYIYILSLLYIERRIWKFIKYQQKRTIRTINTLSRKIKKKSFHDNKQPKNIQNTCSKKIGQRVFIAAEN